MKPNHRRNIKCVRAPQVRVGDVIMLDLDQYGPTVTAVGRNGDDVWLQLDTGEVFGGDPRQMITIAR